MRTRTSTRWSRDWVDATRGLVSREIFVSDEVYRLEMERIFARSWLFLAHESEITEPGDYVVRLLGDAPVIVVRNDGGAVHALLNSCRHRGAKLCRATAGKVRKLVCPYHGWSYERDGRLITTGFDRHFPKGTDFSRMGLVQVPRLASYRGLIFGCWDPAAMDLERYIGDFCWYLDAFFARSPGGMQVLAPPHRWQVKANWKIGALNFIGDSQHIPMTHAGPLTLDPVRSARAGIMKAAENSFQVITKEGHGCTLTYLAPGLPDEAYQTHCRDLEPYYAQMLDAERRALLHHLRVAVGNVFPNFSLIETQVAPAEKAVIIRLWQPLSSTEMEVLSWVLAEREASAQYKESVLAKGFHNFGAAGVFEQDDMEIWASATASSANRVALQFPYSFQTSLPYADKPLTDYKWPGRAFQPPETEVVQFEFMRHWDRLVRSEG
jgi:phenylpropionate dioxygenase-like ring-hydroxylating dioxygenase large terminal subunit